MKTTFARASKYFVLAGLLAGTAAMAQRITPEDWRRWEEEEIKLQKLNPLPDPEPEFWTATTIRGLVFVERLEDVDPKGVDAIGVTVRGPASLDAKGVAGRVWRFLGRNLNYETMRAIHAEVLAYLRDHNRPLVDVIFPEQDVTEGILQIVVREARVGRLELREPGAVTAGFTNRWANTNYLSRMMRLQPGDVVDSKILEQDLDWVTRSPFRSISGQVSFRKGAGELETDIQAQIRHRKPWEVSIGYDNTGSVATDLDRIFAGVSGGKVLGTVDNYATYQFIADPELDHLKAHAVTYAALLPWRHTLRVFGYHSDTSAQISDLSTVTGDSYQASLRYEMPLPRLGRMQHEFSLGLDFKHLGNTLEFGGTVAQDNPWEVFQITAGYVAAASDGWGRTIFTAEGFHSPGGISSLNKDDAYDLIRRGAVSEYTFGRLQLDRWFELPANFYLRVRGGGQLATELLLPSEQLGLGGRNTVRGFPERDVNTDQGWFASVELVSPSLIGGTKLLEFNRDPERFRHGLFLVAFLDYGEGTNFQPLPDETDRELGSVGGGVRYRFRRNADVLFDYGHRIREKGFEPTSGMSGHISVRVSY